jgi:phosphoribosyl-dephospho-CoA transferase
VRVFRKMIFTAEDILNAREERVAFQEKLIKKYIKH